MNWLLDPFISNAFLLRALLAGVLVSISCGIVGTFIVLRGLAFIGDALAHGVLPGIAVSILLGIPGIVGASVGAVVMIGGISLITRKSQLSSDTAIGLLFVGMLALGVVIVSRSTSFTGDIVRVLFGEILGINNQAIFLQAIATLVIAATAFICARPFLLLCFNPEQAQVSGFSSSLYHNIMLAMIAVAVIISFQTVGTMLVFGMLLAPAGAGALIARRIEAMMAWAALIGAISVYTGLLSSYYFNLAAGSSIVLVATIIFFGVLIVKNIQLFRSQKPVKGMRMINNLEEPKTASNPTVTANRLDIGYPDELIVQDVNFTVEKGQSLALVGVNGSGKSTLLKTIVGLLPSLKGELNILGNPPGQSPRQIAYLSQSHKSGFILPLRALDAVRMGRFANHGLLGKMTSVDEELVVQAMKTMRVWNLADKPLRSLSGGQQQRVYLAQVLARHADLLILDEPTAGLDAGAREVYQQAIRNELSRGASVITATHDIQEAMSCDQAMLLARKVIAVGRGKDVITAQSLLETFGIVITFNQNLEMAVVEREHSHTSQADS